MINNDAPGFLPDGTIDTAGIAGGGTIPPSSVRTLGEALRSKSRGRITAGRMTQRLRCSTI